MVKHFPGLYEALFQFPEGGGTEGKRGWEGSREERQREKRRSNQYYSIKHNKR